MIISVGWLKCHNRCLPACNGFSLVDDYWSMIGSGNWDACSLELNFEINLECYDTVMNTEMGRIIDSKLLHSTRVVLSTNEHLLMRPRDKFFPSVFSVVLLSTVLTHERA